MLTAGATLAWIRNPQVRIGVQYEQRETSLGVEAIDGHTSRLKRLMSWLALTLGCIVGLVASAESGMLPIFYDPEWYRWWFLIAVVALLGLGFLAGSLIALRHRKLAGIIFLSVMPVAAFCLAYPYSHLQVWDSSGNYERPGPAIAIGLTVLFYSVFLPPVLVWPRKKRAALIFASAALVAGLIFSYSKWTVAVLLGLAGCSAPFFLFGLFWLRTGNRGWPSLVQPRPWSRAKRVLAFVATCVGILGLDVVVMLVLSGLLHLSIVKIVSTKLASLASWVQWVQLTRHSL
jgi:hypothetical protein